MNARFGLVVHDEVQNPHFMIDRIDLPMAIFELLGVTRQVSWRPLDGMLCKHVGHKLALLPSYLGSGGQRRYSLVHALQKVFELGRGELRVFGQIA